MQIITKLQEKRRALIAKLLTPLSQMERNNVEKQIEQVNLKLQSEYNKII